MAILMRVVDEGYRPIPEGRYHVRLVGINYGKGHYDEVYIFTFEITKGEYSHCRCNLLINQKKRGECKTRTKMHLLVEALSGEEFKKTEERDLEKLIDRECYAYIEMRTSPSRPPSNRIYRLEPLDDK